ncbi:MAG: hypothetical protein QG594_1448 [Bacteroidota bacterium]|nr:hypothetical protein [Bacteroidota bacterium]
MQLNDSFFNRLNKDKMELQTAIEILEYHQEWRLGKREDMIYEPKKLTEALDVVLGEVKKFRLGAVSG